MPLYHSYILHDTHGWKCGISYFPFHVREYEFVLFFISFRVSNISPPSYIQYFFGYLLPSTNVLIIYNQKGPIRERVTASRGIDIHVVAVFLHTAEG